MATRPRTVQFGLLLFVFVAMRLVLADEGIHPRTTTRLLDAFEELAGDGPAPTSDAPDSESPTTSDVQGKLARATFGSGCFWCTEAVFEEMRGVKQVVSGFSGGRLPYPTYEQVLTGLTGHAEVVQIEYDPSVVSYKKLLEAFWFTHDPTTLNRQGVDIGTQYRSVIFFHNKQQRELAELYRQKLNQAKAYRKPIVTQIAEFEAFYPAKSYHQDYYAQNGRKRYCQTHIRPKVRKFRRIFRDDLKGSDGPEAES